MIRSVLAILAIGLGLAGPAIAQPAMPADTQGAPIAVARAIALTERGSWTAAANEAADAGPVARDIVEWLRLRQGDASYGEARDFLARRGDWPGLDRIRIGNEQFLPIDAEGDLAREVVAYFGDATPETGHGVLSLVTAQRALGQMGEAEALAALAWVSLSLTATTETRLLDLYPDALGALAADRADAMFWSAANNALRRAIDRLPEDDRARHRARLQARGGGAVDDRFDADAGVRYARFRQAYAGDRYETATNIVAAASVSAESLGDPAAWARARRDLVRRLMREQAYERAYALAASHWLTDGRDFADLEWLAGYIALRFAGTPEQALQHFKRFRSAVFTPISLGRAGYWLGEAHAALGHVEEAAEAYALGAQFQTSFYGLLAAEALGLDLDPALTGQQDYPDIADLPVAGNSVLEAALLLQAAGQRDLSERFFTHLTESLDEEAAGALADLALRLGETHIALLIAKRAATQGIVLPRAYFPIIEPGVENNPVSDELALSIARRESEFDPGVSSGVGARGLMQLMPTTAREVAGQLGLGYSSDRLFTDPTYNATLGTAYLAGLIRRFGDNPVLVSSGYNAGPGRPARWIRERGDPREPDVDVIDWIEHIPFDETRNYAMRVAESVPVYRARLSGKTRPLEFTDLLKGR